MQHSSLAMHVYFLLLITCLFSHSAISSPFQLPLESTPVNLKPFAQMYTGNEYSGIDTLIESDVIFSDFSVKPHLPNEAEHWIKIELMNSSDGPLNWYLHLGYPSMPLMHAYWEKGGDIEVISLLDSQSSYDDRVVDEPQLFLLLNLAGKEVKTLYVNYRNLGNAPLSLDVFSEISFKKYQLTEILINSAVLGFMLAILCLVIMFLTMNRDVLYFYFACLVLFMGLVISDLSGYNHKYLWPHSGGVAAKFVEYIMISIHLSYLYFIREVMMLKAQNSALYKVLTGFIVAGFLLLIISMFFDLFELLILFGFLLIPVFVLTSVWGIKARVVSAKIIALSIYSHIFFVFLLFVLSIVAFNPFPSIYFMKYATIGYLLEAVFFTITLAHRSYVTNRDYQKSLLLRVEEANNLVKAEQKNNLLLIEKQEQLLKFTGTVHDIFQPLSSVRMAVGVIPEESGKDIKNYIDNTVEYAESLLKSFMLDSKDRFQDLSRNLVLGEVFEQVVLRHQAAAKEKSIQLQFFNSSKACEVPQENLIRILDNLMSNAIRYTKSGGVLLGVRQKLTGVEIQVIDTGIGMSSIESKKLLAPFEQSELGRQGYGIGLYVVKSLCAQSGFELSVSSVVNKGTCFKILIPK